MCCICHAAVAIENITDNFQLGFGSFVDKRLVPYISVETARFAYINENNTLSNIYNSCQYKYCIWGNTHGGKL